MILIDAIYINQSGGKNLLDLLIDQLNLTSSEEILVLVDNRIKKQYEAKRFKAIRLEFIRGNEIGRYFFYKNKVNEFRKVFCFANVPPPVKLNCTVLTYFHNIILFDKDIQKYFSIKSHLLFVLKGLVIKSRKNNTNYWVVQTDNVLHLLIKYLNIPLSKILVLPFFEKENSGGMADTNVKKNSFFYPASGAAHKNHSNLLEVWHDLYLKNNFQNELHLTINKNQNRNLYNRIKLLQANGVPIINHGYLSKSEVNALYAKCRYVIHPSFGESFGLVLIEGLINNCILLAPNLPYVKAIVQPHYFFEPKNHASITHSIKKALYEEDPMPSKILIKNKIEDLVKQILD